MIYTIDDGEVFSWGSGRYGRLGQGHLRDRFSPLMIDCPLRGRDVVQVACHEFHSAALCGEPHPFILCHMIHLNREWRIVYMGKGRASPWIHSVR